MTAPTWDTVRARFTDRCGGETIATPQLEQAIATAYDQHGELVIRAMNRVGQTYAAGKIRGSAWGLLGTEVVRAVEHERARPDPLPTEPEQLPLSGDDRRRFVADNRCPTCDRFWPWLSPCPCGEHAGDVDEPEPLLAAHTGGAGS